MDDEQAKKAKQEKGNCHDHKPLKDWSHRTIVNHNQPMYLNSKQLIKEIEEPTRMIAAILAQLPAKAPPPLPVTFACLLPAVFILQHLNQAGNRGIASEHLSFLNVEYPYFEVF